MRTILVAAMVFTSACANLHSQQTIESSLRKPAADERVVVICYGQPDEATAPYISLGTHERIKCDTGSSLKIYGKESPFFEVKMMTFANAVNEAKRTLMKSFELDSYGDWASCSKNSAQKFKIIPIGCAVIPLQ